MQLWIPLHIIKSTFTKPITSTVDDALILLGVENNTEPRFALDVSSHDMRVMSDIAAKSNGVDINTLQFSQLREVSGKMSVEDTGILGQARSLLYWSTNQRFCGKCGHKTVASHGGMIPNTYC
jgi:NAD+ diphosphatase